MDTNDKVRYNGDVRPWLRNRNGKINSMNLSKTSALVEFESDGVYRKSSEWVGINALTPIADVSSARQKVLDEKIKLEKQISELRSKVSKLNAADKALKDLGL